MHDPLTLILSSVDVTGDVTRHDDMLADAIAGRLRRDGRTVRVRSIRETSRMQELRKSRENHAEIARLIVETPPDLTVFVIHEALYFFGYGLHPADMFRQVRERTAGLIAVAGAVGTMEADHLLANELVDCCILGDAESVVAELVARLASKRDWTDVSGIACRRDTEIVRNRLPRREPEISICGPIVRDLYERIRPDVSIDFPMTTWSSRGCYARCSFCAIPAGAAAQDGPRQQLRPISEVVEELRHLHETYGVTDFQFADSNFIMPGKAGEKRVLEICEALGALPFRMTFRIDTRADTVNPKVIRALKASGLRTILLGIESFHDPDLFLFRKDMDARTIESSLGMLAEEGFSTHANSPLRIRVGMILFHPYTTLAGLSDNIVGIRKFRISPKKLRTRLQPHRGLPLLDAFPEAVCSDTGKLCFRSPAVATVLDRFTKVFDDRHCIAYDTIRNLEKLSLVVGKPAQSAQLGLLRRQVEDMSYDFFERLIAASGEEVGGYGGRAASSVAEAAAEAFDRWKAERKVDACVESAGTAIGYERRNYKLLRRLRVA